MKLRAFLTVLVLTVLLAGCASAGQTTAPTGGATTTSGVTTTAQVTTKAVEKPQYGGTLRLVMIADISSWDQGLTFC